MLIGMERSNLKFEVCQHSDFHPIKWFDLDKPATDGKPIWQVGFQQLF